MARPYTPTRPRIAWRRSALPTLAAMWRALVTRRHLARMDDRQLRDIGLGRAEALREAERAPWDLGPRR